MLLSLGWKEVAVDYSTVSQITLPRTCRLDPTTGHGAGMTTLIIVKKCYIHYTIFLSHKNISEGK
jgi:hypothetical protein